MKGRRPTSGNKNTVVRINTGFRDQRERWNAELQGEVRAPFSPQILTRTSAFNKKLLFSVETKVQ
jgi:hypothetical protein